MKNQTISLTSLLLLLAVLIPLTHLPLNARTWTSKSGHTENGDLKKFDGKSVTIRLEDGNHATFPLDSLSLTDQEFIKNNHTPPPNTPQPKKNIFNWDDPWPDKAVVKDVEITVETEDVEKKEFVYTSNHFRFTCDVRLTSTVVSTFAKMFEATHQYCDLIPLSFKNDHEESDKYDIRLFEHKEDYIKAGGFPSSSGIFFRKGKKSWIMVPLVSLGVQKFGSGYRRDRDKDDSTLVHEIVHQLSPLAYSRTGTRGWFSEGFAEYVAQTPYRNGRFKIANNFDEIIEYFTAFGKDGTGGRNLGREFTAPALRDFLNMPYQEFLANSNFNYGLGLCITTYFLHLEGEGNASLLKAYLAKLRENYPIKTKEKLQEIQKILLNGRTWEELEKDITKKWRKKGIKITFSPSSSYK